MLKTLFSATRSFLFQSTAITKTGPHIRDAIDIKRIMFLVIIALIPCVFVAIWNSGVQALIYNTPLMNEYIAASSSLKGYFSFGAKHWKEILTLGSYYFLPLVLISYVVGGFWETLFAAVRKTEIAEGFLVTGLLYPLILPPTIPYWMAALGVSVGVIISKEIFGGTGMNILNPALVCRCFLYFAFPAAMTGQVWVAQNSPDAYSAQTALAVYHMGENVSRIHVEAILANEGTPSSLNRFISGQLSLFDPTLHMGSLDPTQLKNFLTTPVEQGGLGLNPDNLEAAMQFARLKTGSGLWSNWNLFLGNKLGSFGEVSILACVIGAAILLFTQVASWRTMLAVLIGSLVTAILFQYGSHLGIYLGAWNRASFDFPAYKHLLMGGLVFGLVFMATDPVSSPSESSAKWAYGLLIGMMTIVIRAINPAYPESVMLAILFANVFAPLFDHYAIRFKRRRRRAFI